MRSPRNDDPEKFSVTSGAEIASGMATFAERLERTLADYLKGTDGSSTRLFEAMRYTVLAGGKRLRPYIVNLSAEMFEVAASMRLRAGAAVEMIHCYSLIHDDLPAIDNDNLRRGIPTCHVMFDEATAILAGDALLTLAFDILAKPDTHPDPGVRSELVLALARASGANGMVSGQMFDIESEHALVTQTQAEHLARLKTGALIAFSAEAGAILGKAGSEARANLRAFGRELGLAFQISDDLLDLEGDEAVVGKRVGKDSAAGKATLVSLLGRDGARSEVNRLTESAIARLDMFGKQGEKLRTMTRFILSLDRDYVFSAAKPGPAPDQ